MTIAGQIPLLPRTLTFKTPRDVIFDAVLALQHVRRIIEVMGDSRKGGAGWIGRGWIEGVVGWYVGDETVERTMRAVWDEFAERVSPGWSRMEGRYRWLTSVSPARLPEDTSPLRGRSRAAQGRFGRVASHKTYGGAELASYTSSQGYRYEWR